MRFIDSCHGMSLVFNNDMRGGMKESRYTIANRIMACLFLPFSLWLTETRAGTLQELRYRTLNAFRANEHPTP